MYKAVWLSFGVKFADARRLSVITGESESQFECRYNKKERKNMAVETIGRVALVLRLKIWV